MNKDKLKVLKTYILSTMSTPCTTEKLATICAVLELLIDLLIEDDEFVYDREMARKMLTEKEKTCEVKDD